MFVVWPPTVYWRERGLPHFGQKLNSEHIGEWSDGSQTKIHLHIEKALDYPWSYQLCPYEGILERGSNKDLKEA
jgi:hypothetical protein